MCFRFHGETCPDECKKNGLKESFRQVGSSVCQSVLAKSFYYTMTGKAQLKIIANMNETAFTTSSMQVYTTSSMQLGDMSFDKCSEFNELRNLAMRIRC
jgi:hypothetical protein